MSEMTIERHNLDGTGYRDCEAYTMPMPPGGSAWWDAITDVPCPVDNCDQTLVWYEAGYVPGYRVCMRGLGEGRYDLDTIQHRFQFSRSGKLVRE